MNGPLDHFSNQQRERDSNSNINRDMVLLVVLVVMIQVSIQNFFNYYKCAMHNRAESFFQTRFPSFLCLSFSNSQFKERLGRLELESCDFENILASLSLLWSPETMYGQK
jgi:hypothetical protein